MPKPYLYEIEPGVIWAQDHPFTEREIAVLVEALAIANGEEVESDER